uniref:Serine/threonine-protein kinase RIO2 n=1 Tax=Steinernema glaseri TaxID=37863 RepID=A0A1I7Z4Z3_9BILA
MGRMNVHLMRYLDPEHFRVLIAVEMGMRNHEVVPLPLISSIAGIHRGATCNALSDLSKNRLVLRECGKKYDGYHLTNLGFDFLALRTLVSRGVVGSVGNQIGVGKESDVFVGGDPELNDVVLKFHRLGRTSFRKIKEKRDYLKKRRSCNWLYLARLAAQKEYAFLKALADRGFSVPKPLDVCRHTVVMGLIEGKTLCDVSEVEDVPGLYDKLMNLIMRMGRYGLIHGDFNEFNLMINQKGEPVMIDFPQMVSIDHPNADFYFKRDVDCVREFFRKRFAYESEEFPEFQDVERKHSLDAVLEASGFTKQMALDLNKAFDEGRFGAHLDGKKEESSDEDDEDEEDEEEVEYDEEELEEQRQVQQQAAKELSKMDRFNNWLQTAQTHVDELVIENEECPELLEMDEERQKKYEAAVAEVEEKLKSAVIEKRAGDPDDEEDDAQDEKVSVAGSRYQPRGKVTGTRSVYSCGSTIAPEDIKNRLMRDKKKSAPKKKLKVKGEHSAVSRGRKNNLDVIKEYAGWEF